MAEPKAAPEMQQPHLQQAPQAHRDDMGISQTPAAPGNDAGISQPPPSYEPSQQNGGEKGMPTQDGRPRMVTPLDRLGDQPADVDCPYCRKMTRTRVREEHSSMTMISGVLIGILCICAACIPCIARSCQDVDQYCSECGKKLTHKPYDGATQVVAVGPADMAPSKYA